MDHAVAKCNTVKWPLKPAFSQPHKTHLLEATLQRENLKSAAVASSVILGEMQDGYRWGNGEGEIMATCKGKFTFF